MNKIGNGLIFISIFSLNLLIIFWFGYLKVDAYQQDKKINNYIHIDNTKKDKTYFGYISIPEYNIKRLIKNGDPNTVIEEGYVGIYGFSPSDLKKESLMLVGHSRSNIFESIHNLNIDSNIEIYINKKRYKYKVEQKLVISVEDTNFFTNINGSKLILITCMEDNSKRLIIKAKLI